MYHLQSDPINLRQDYDDISIIKRSIKCLPFETIRGMGKFHTFILVIIKTPPWRGSSSQRHRIPRLSCILSLYHDIHEILIAHIVIGKNSRICHLRMYHIRGLWINPSIQNRLVARLGHSFFSIQRNRSSGRFWNRVPGKLIDHFGT